MRISRLAELLRTSGAWGLSGRSCSSGRLHGPAEVYHRRSWEGGREQKQRGRQKHVLLRTSGSLGKAKTRR